MPEYHHGARVIQDNSGLSPIKSVNTAVIGVPITAPMGPVGESVLIAGSRSTAAQFSNNIGTNGTGFTCDTFFDIVFKQIGAMMIVVNVLDPAVHKQAVAAKEYTFDATSNEFTPDNEYNYARVVKSQDLLTTYAEGDDFTYDMTINKYFRVDGGAIAVGEVISLACDIPDASLVDDAAVIGAVDAQGVHTGLQALRVASAKFGFKPKITGAPGLDTLAVANEIVSINAALKAFGYVYCDGAAVAADAVTYRNNFGSDQIMPIFPDFTDTNSNSLSAVSFALGTRARLDNEIGWHKTISNMPVIGAGGISKDISWDLQDPNTLAGYLNANEVTTLINMKGFRFWGSRTASNDAKFAFESTVRTRDFLSDTIAEAMFEFIDKPMSKTLIKTIIDSINAKFRSLKASGYIVDANAWIDPDKNTEVTLTAGELNISFDYMAVPPLENLTLYQKLESSYAGQLLAA